MYQTFAAYPANQSMGTWGQPASQVLIEIIYQTFSNHFSSPTLSHLIHKVIGQHLIRIQLPITTSSINRYHMEELETAVIIIAALVTMHNR